MQTHKATIYDKRGNILSIGYNSYTKSHPYQAKLAALVDEPYKIYLHAEIQAIVNLRGGKPYHLHVERFNKRGLPMNSKPCKICQQAIKLAGIKEVTYSVHSHI